MDNPTTPNDRPGTPEYAAALDRANAAMDKLNQALDRLWAATKPQTPDVLLERLRRFAIEYAMTDAALCETLRHAIGRIEAANEATK